jgi:hypothetical protein
MHVSCNDFASWSPNYLTTLQYDKQTKTIPNCLAIHSASLTLSYTIPIPVFASRMYPSAIRHPQCIQMPYADNNTRTYGDHATSMSDPTRHILRRIRSG